MTLFVLIKYLHFIAIFGMVSTVVAQHLLFKDQMTRQEIRRVSIIDSIYGGCAILVLVMGLLMWFVVGKPSAYYSANWVFHLKVGLFVLVGLLSIIPTRFLLKNRKGDQQELLPVPKSMKMIIRLELLLLFLIPLLATSMAQGIGALVSGS
jgi:putative membrane protein